MGCLFAVFEIIGDLLEDLIEGIFKRWFTMMQWIIPPLLQPRWLRRLLKLCVCVFSWILLISCVLGLVAMLGGEPEAQQWGRSRFLGSLGISALQIAIGAVFRFLRR